MLLRDNEYLTTASTSVTFNPTSTKLPTEVLSYRYFSVLLLPKGVWHTKDPSHLNVKFFTCCLTETKTKTKNLRFVCYMFFFHVHTESTSLMSFVFHWLCRTPSRCPDSIFSRPLCWDCLVAWDSSLLKRVGNESDGVGALFRWSYKSSSKLTFPGGCWL